MKRLNDIEILDMCQAITSTISTIYALSTLPLTNEDVEQMVKECCKKMHNGFTILDWWLNTKSDYEIVQMLQTDTITNFLDETQSYLQVGEASHSGMDIEKGYYNIYDDFYMCVERWHEAFKRRLGYILKTQHENHQQDTEKLTHSEPQQPTLPMELDNDEAAKYFAKAIEIGLMDESYNWSKGMQLLSCFAREMSLRLGLNKAQNSDGTQRISWQPFEQLFKIDKGKLRSNYNDIQKTGQTPHGIELIDKIFE